jgi:hypothetical protein
MKLWTIPAALVATLMLGACEDWCDDDHGDPPPPPSSRPVVFDSDIEWIGDSHTSLPGFSTSISDLFEPNRVRNYAIGGTFMRVWSPVFGPNAFYFQQRVGETTCANCFILLGTADAGFPPFTSNADFRLSMDVLVGQWLSDGAGKVWIMTPPKVQVSFHDPAFNVRIEGFRREILQFCRNKVHRAMGIRCGPDLFKLIDPAIHVRPTFAGMNDGVHLNAEGNAVVEAEIRRLLKL